MSRISPGDVGPLLRRAYLASSHVFSDTVRPFGLDPRAYGILSHLEAAGPLSQRRLIDLSGEDKSTMVRTIDDLERMGLAERRRDPVDRRANAVQITDQGRAVRAKAAEETTKLFARLFGGFSPAELGSLVDSLRRFIAAAERHAGTHSPGSAAGDAGE